MPTGLPDVKIIRHASAKQLRLRVFINEVKLTVPQHCSKRQIQQFLIQSEPWLYETWQNLILQKDNQSFPEEIFLFNRENALNIIVRQQKQRYIFDEENHVVFLNDQKNLKDFILMYAKIHLSRYLSHISQEIKIPYSNLQVRFVKSRWGSCNKQHKIMLNALLVLLPLSAVRYVCVHELVHTIHFDHSISFWQRVEMHDANYKVHVKQLKEFQWPWWML